MTPTREQLDALIQLYQSGQLQKAESACRHLLNTEADSFALNNLLGLILQGQGKLPEAVTAHNKAIEQEPANAKAYTNRGTALMRLNKHEMALADFDKAIEWQAELAGAHLNRGILLSKLGQLQAALASCERAIQLEPGLSEAYSSCGNILKDLGRVEEALAKYRVAIKLKPGNFQAHSNLLMAQNYLTDHRNDEVLQAVQAFAAALEQHTLPAFPRRPLQKNPDRLSLGLVSADLRNHPVGYFLEDLLVSLAESRLDLVAFSCTSEKDDLSARIRPFFKDWFQLHDKSDSAAARLIYDQEIDILIDLSGHTANNRLPLFASKPAPIQVSWLGYFASTGLSDIDYLLTDPHLSPPGSEEYFSEQLWHLPTTRWCFSTPRCDYTCSSLPALQNGHITFASFHNLTKLNSRVIEMWSALLQAIPASRLLLKSPQLRDTGAREGFLAQFAQRGVKQDRIVMEGPESREQYLAAYNRVDIALDPFPFTGGATSIEALWMGVPFITLAGDTLAARQGVSILKNAGHDEWIAETEEQYLEKVVALAQDLPALQQHRTELRQQLLASPLCDSTKFANDFEETVFAIWNQTASAISC